MRFVLARKQYGKTGYNKSRYVKKKPYEPNNNHLYEGLLSKIKNVLSRLDNMDKAYNPASRVKEVWVRNDETIHPLRGVDSPS
jgi:hypothetical protein